MDLMAMSTTELFERRRDNLSRIIDQWIASQRFKTGKEICEYYGLSAAYVAQLLNSKRQIGEKAARALEQQLGLDLLSLDQPETRQMLQLDSAETLHLYAMQLVEQELFRFKVLEAVHHQIQPTIQLQPNHYALQISSDVYAPILKSGWWLWCDRQRRPQPADLLCIQLVNELCLVLELQAETEQALHCQSLDAKRQICFHKQDIQQADVVMAILHPEQIQAT